MLSPYGKTKSNRFWGYYGYKFIYATITLEKNLLNSIVYNVWKRVNTLYWNGNITCLHTIFVVFCYDKKIFLQSFYNWYSKTIVEAKNLIKSTRYALAYKAFKINYLQGLCLYLIVISYKPLIYKAFFYCIIQPCESLSI